MEIASAEKKENVDSEMESNPCLSAYGTTLLRILPLDDRIAVRIALLRLTCSRTLIQHRYSIFFI